MRLPNEIPDPTLAGKTARLLKSIYGLKQAGRAWNEHLQSFLSNNDWTQSLSDPCLSTYFDKTHQCNVHLLLYVDDILLFSPSLTAIESAKSLLRTRFDISDGGSATYILGVSIEHKQDRISLHQHGFIERTLSKFQDLIPSIQKPIPVHSSNQTTKEVENSNTIPIATAQSIIGRVQLHSTLGLLKPNKNSNSRN